MCHFMYDLCSLRMQVASGCFCSINSIFFWSIIATLQHCGKVEVKLDVGLVTKYQVNMMITVWLFEFLEVNVLLFLSILNLLVCLEVLKAPLETC